MSARPIAIACCSPPESFAADLFMRRSMSGKSSTTFPMFQGPCRLAVAPIWRFSLTVRLGKRRRPSGTIAKPMCDRCDVGSVARFLSRKETEPAWIRT